MTQLKWFGHMKENRTSCQREKTQNTWEDRIVKTNKREDRIVKINKAEQKAKDRIG